MEHGLGLIDARKRKEEKVQRIIGCAFLLGIVCGITIAFVMLILLGVIK